MEHNMTLSPAQLDFVRQTFPEMNSNELHVELAGRAASQRSFTRLGFGKQTFILVEWDSADEDWPRFLSIGRARGATSYLLPEIFADDPKHGLILEEDLGAVTLRKLCESAPNNRESILRAYCQTFDALLCWQQPQVAAHPVVAARSMDVDTFLWETGYFARFCVSDYCGCEALLTIAWDKERMRLAQECSLLPQTALHRDFQSENILHHEELIRFVDFQGARLGPAEYDVASLLYDPYIPQLDKTIRDELYQYYCNASRRTLKTERPLYLCAAQRLMQALGAYGNLSLHKGKPWYGRYIPEAIRRLVSVTESLDDYPVLHSIVHACAAKAGNNEQLTSKTSLPER